MEKGDILILFVFYLFAIIKPNHFINAKWNKGNYLRTLQQFEYVQLFADELLIWVTNCFTGTCTKKSVEQSDRLINSWAIPKKIHEIRSTYRSTVSSKLPTNVSKQIFLRFLKFTIYLTISFQRYQDRQNRSSHWKVMRFWRKKLYKNDLLFVRTVAVLFQNPCPFRYLTLVVKVWLRGIE